MNDGQTVSLTFNGIPIGGLLRYEFFQGEPRQAVFRSLNASAAVARPGQPDFGRIVLDVFRDKNDPGQAALQSSLRNRTTGVCVLTLEDGTTDTFDAFCLLFPLAGSKSQTAPVVASRITLRISGPIT